MKLYLDGLMAIVKSTAPAHRKLGMWLADQMTDDDNAPMSAADYLLILLMLLHFVTPIVMFSTGFAMFFVGQYAWAIPMTVCGIWLDAGLMYAICTHHR